MPSWQFQGSCYPTPLAANQAAASASSGVASGGVVVSATSVTDSTITYDVVDLTSGVTTQRVVSVTPQPCNLLGYDDAVQLGWLFIAMFVSVYAVRYLASMADRFFNGAPNDT